MNVDDIVITRNNTKGIDSMKYLQKHVQTKNLGSLKYFLDIKVARSKKGTLLSQRKYVLDLFSEAGMLGCMSIDSSMEMNTKLLPNQEELLEDAERYKRLVKN